MERLTRRNSIGVAFYPDFVPQKEDNGKFMRCLYALIDRLAIYEDAEEQGRLVVLPCKVGDTVYLKTIRKQMIIEGYSLLKCTDFSSLCYHCRCAEHDKTRRKGERVINVCPKCAFGEKCFQGFRLSDFNRTVFLTREDANTALTTSVEFTRLPESYTCPRCKNGEHTEDAKFCKICGLRIE